MAIGFQCFPVEIWEEMGMRVDSMAAHHGEYLFHLAVVKKDASRQQEGQFGVQEQWRTRSESRRCYPKVAVAHM